MRQSCGAMRSFLTLLLSVSIIMSPAATRAALADEPWTAEQWHQTLAVAEDLRDITARDLNRPGACPWDVEAQAAQLGYDIEKCFAFVRDEIRSEPYAGVLRGARGTLSGRAGNARDKSLLLAAMLNAGGHQARVVTGKIGVEAANTLVAGFFAADPLAGVMSQFPAQRANNDEQIASFSNETGLNAGAIAEANRLEAQLADDLFNGTWAKSQPHFEALSRWLREAKVSLGKTPDAWKDELVARAADHAWVQVADATGANQWIDLDPTIAGSTRGQRHGQEPQPLDPIKDRHIVTIRVDYRHTVDGKPKAEPIVEVDVPADDALYDAPSLSVYPVDPGLPSMDKMASMTPEQHRNAILALKHFQATVRVGGSIHSSRPFDLKGNILEATSDGRIKGASQIGSAVGGMFGGLAGESEKPAADDAGSFVDLTVTFVFKSPGKAPRHQSRMLYQASDLKAARIKRPLFDWQILIQPQPISSDSAAYALARYTLDLYGPLLDLMKASVQGATIKAVVADAERIAKSIPAPYPTSLVQFAQFRQRAMARVLSESKGAVRLLWDSPQVYVLDRRVCMGREKGDVCGQLRIDIVDNRIAFVPTSSGSAEASVWAALRMGAFETVGEAEVIRQLVPDVPVRSPLDAFDSVIAANGKTVAFAASANVPPDARLLDVDQNWLRENQFPSELIIAAVGKATSDTESVWWSVDLATGSAVGRTSGGRGQAQTEYSTIVTNYLQHVACWAGVFGEMLVGVREIEKGNVLSLDQGKRAFLLGKGFIECVMGLSKVDWAKPSSWKSAWEAAKKMKSAMGGLMDAVYALS